jgi:hypothetical protein
MATDPSVPGLDDDCSWGSRELFLRELTAVLRLVVDTLRLDTALTDGQHHNLDCPEMGSMISSRKKPKQENIATAMLPKFAMKKIFAFSMLLPEVIRHTRFFVTKGGDRYIHRLDTAGACVSIDAVCKTWRACSQDLLESLLADMAQLPKAQHARLCRAMVLSDPNMYAGGRFLANVSRFSTVQVHVYVREWDPVQNCLHASSCVTMPLQLRWHTKWASMVDLDIFLLGKIDTVPGKSITHCYTVCTLIDTVPGKHFWLIALLTDSTFD